MTDKEAAKLKPGDKVLCEWRLPVKQLNFDGENLRSVLVQFYNLRLELFPSDIICKVEDDAAQR